MDSETMQERVEALKLRLCKSKSEKKRILENEIATLEKSFWLSIPWRRQTKKWEFWR